MDFWTNNQSSQNVVTWRGIAFEGVCYRHMPHIKKALGISGVVSSQSSLVVQGTEEIEGCQIDMLISRKDNVVNMCEMKFYNEEFTVNKSYHMTLTHRLNILSETLPRRMSVHSTLITTYGLKYNEYSGDFQQVITLDDLFD